MESNNQAHEKKWKYEMKEEFRERMKKMMKSEGDFLAFEEIVHREPRNFIRCNTLKISPSELVERLSRKWDVEQPFEKFPEIILVKSELAPGELGNALEHLLGYYYIQEVSSMMSVIALDPKPKERVLDLFASPGSKTTQIAARLENTGAIVANDLKISRIKILVSNLERCGVTNAIVTRKDAIALCARLSKSGFRKFDKILLDVPCSGEGTLRSSPSTFLNWNLKIVRKLSRQQKKFLAFALRCLRPGGTLVYSTCTHSPEENEEIVSFALENFPLRAESFSLPLHCRAPLSEWNDARFHPDVEKAACRIYPHDNDSEGFFVAKFRLAKEV